jgi:hypothetical protein
VHVDLPAHIFLGLHWLERFFTNGSIAGSRGRLGRAVFFHVSSVNLLELLNI